jgi:transposase-like protein
MKARFTDEQIIAMIKEQEAGEKTADVCRRHGISSATFCKYKSKYVQLAQITFSIGQPDTNGIFTEKGNGQDGGLTPKI